MTTPIQGFDPNQSTDPANSGAGGDVPYASFLAELPESVRPLADPIFKKWDGDVTQRFQAVHAEYAPYKELIDTWEPDALKAAADMLVQLRSDPRAVYDAIAEAYNYNAQGQPSATPGSTPVVPAVVPAPATTPTQYDLQSDPRYTEMVQNQEQLAKIILEERQQRETQQYSAMLDQTLGALHAQFDKNIGGKLVAGFDEGYVLTQISQGIEPQKAVENFQAMMNSYAGMQNQPLFNAPTVMGNGGGLPTNQVDPGKMDAKQRTTYMAQMLAQANAQG